MAEGRLLAVLLLAAIAAAAAAPAAPAAGACAQCATPQQRAGSPACARCGGGVPALPSTALAPAGNITAAAGANGRRPAQSSSSVLLFYLCEFFPHYGQARSQCSNLLRAAKDQGSRSVNLVPTSYWMDDSASKAFKAGACYPDNWMGKSSLDYFCQRWEWDTPCNPWNAEALKRMTDGIRDCIQEAHDMFDEVLISPHLDDGTKTMHWRNMLWFDPLKKDKYGYSYWDTMLGPILKAVKEVYTTPGKTFIFGPEGEMGGTVFYAPESYQKIVDRVRQEYKGPAQVQVALMFNHAFVPGVVNRGDDPPDMRAGPPTKMAAIQGWGPLKPFSQWPERERLARALPAARKLLDGADVIGVSCYPRTGAEIKAEDLESCMTKLDAELKAMGFDIRAWRSRPGKRLIWSEFGLGGGVSRCGDTPARSRGTAGRWAHLGVGYPWTAEKDPWARPELRSYRREWHNATLQLFNAGGGAYPIDGAFMWNLVSMDPQGIHPASSTPNGTFRDDVIADAIRKHNEAVAAKQ